MKSKANQSQGMLLFHLSAKQSFAIGTLKVKEIVPYTQLTAMPHSHRPCSAPPACAAPPSR